MLRSIALCLLALPLLLLATSPAAAHHNQVNRAANFNYNATFQVSSFPVSAYSYNNAALAAQLNAQYVARQQAAFAYQCAPPLQAPLPPAAAPCLPSAAYSSFSPRPLLVPTQPYATFGVNINGGYSRGLSRGYYGR